MTYEEENYRMKNLAEGNHPPFERINEWIQELENYGNIGKVFSLCLKCNVCKMFLTINR